MEGYVGKHQKEPGHPTRDIASPVDNVRSPDVALTQLHADALITLDRQLAGAVKDLVAVAPIEALY